MHWRAFIIACIALLALAAAAFLYVLYVPSGGTSHKFMGPSLSGWTEVARFTDVRCRYATIHTRLFTVKGGVVRVAGRARPARREEAVGMSLQPAGAKSDRSWINFYLDMEWPWRETFAFWGTTGVTVPPGRYRLAADIMDSTFDVTVYEEP